MKKIITLFLSVLLLLPVSCDDGKMTPDNERIQVVATLFPQYDFARNIAGDRAEVTLLISQGSDAHTYDPSFSDIARVNGCDIFLYTGKDMESWAQTFTGTLSDDTVVVDLSQGIVHSEEHKEEGHSHADPHIFTSPKKAILMAEKIAAALISCDPEGEELYRENLEKYKEELEKLSEEFTYLAKNSGGRTLFFGGKFSFHYLMEDYGFSYMTLYDGCSESAEPSAKRLSQMTRLMKEESASVIFYPELTTGKAAFAIAEETGARALMLHSCHNLSNDDYKAGEDYISLMQNNIQSIREAIS